MARERHATEDSEFRRTEFARQLRVTRMIRYETLKDWSEKSGIDPAILSRLEHGKLKRIPGRNELLALSEQWGLTQEEEDRLMIGGAMYIPRLPDTLQNPNSTDFSILSNGLRELLGRAPRQGFLEMLTRRIAESSKNTD